MYEYATFIHSAVNEHLGCFHFLIIMNTAVIIQVQILCRCMFLILLDIYLGAELLDYMVTLCLTIGGTCRFFSEVAVPFHSPTSSV